MVGLVKDFFSLLAQMLEHQMEVREKEVQALQSQALALSQEDAGLAEVDGQQRRVTDTFSSLQEPLQQRRQQLLASKEAHQFNRDLEDEIVSGLHLMSCMSYTLEVEGSFFVVSRLIDLTLVLFYPWAISSSSG